MTRVYTAAVDWGRLGYHVPLHVDGERAIIGTLHIDWRNAAEPLRGQMNLRHEGGDCDCSKARACVGNVLITAIVIKNLPYLVGPDCPADPFRIEDCVDKHDGLRIAMFNVLQRFAVSRQESA